MTRSILIPSIINSVQHLLDPTKRRVALQQTPAQMMPVHASAPSVPAATHPLFPELVQAFDPLPIYGEPIPELAGPDLDSLSAPRLVSGLLESGDRQATTLELLWLAAKLYQYEFQAQRNGDLGDAVIHFSLARTEAAKPAFALHQERKALPEASPYADVSKFARSSEGKELVHVRPAFRTRNDDER